MRPKIGGQCQGSGKRLETLLPDMLFDSSPDEQIASDDKHESDNKDQIVIVEHAIRNRQYADYTDERD